MNTIAKYYNDLIEKIKETFHHLEPRERLLLVLLTSFLLLFLMATGIFQLATLKWSLSDRVSQIRDQYNYMLQFGSFFHEDSQYQIADIEPSQFFLTFNSLLEEHRIVVSSLDELNENDREKYQINLQIRSVKVRNLFQFLYDLEISNRIPAKIEKLSFRKSLSAEESYDIDLEIRIREN